MIDIFYTFYKDCPGKDPDGYSKTLLNYHKLLWEKQLPNGKNLVITESVRPGSGANCLLIKTDEYDGMWASDSICHSYSHGEYKSIELSKQIPTEQRKLFYDKVSTIGGYLVFPGNKIDNSWTINQARGFIAKISDRFDLTLECIKRFYAYSSDTPLAKTLNRYNDYFKLFGDFNGYCEFFLLQDLVDDNDNIKFFLPSDNFQSNSPIPHTMNEYDNYMNKVIDFIEQRNMRILKYQDS